MARSRRDGRSSARSGSWLDHRRPVVADRTAAIHPPVDDRSTRMGSRAPRELRRPARFAWTITTRERDLTGRTILALRRASTCRTALSGQTPRVNEEQPTWSRFIRRATAPGTQCAVAGTSSSSVPPSPPAARSPRCSPRAPRRAEAERPPSRPSAGGSAAPSAASTAGSPCPVHHGPGEGGDPSTEPALQEGLRRLQGAEPCASSGTSGRSRASAPKWDRLARAALESGEPVGLVMIDGLFVRAWTRDGLLADLGADPRMAAVLARVPAHFHLGRSWRDHHASLSPRPEQRRPDHGPVLQQGVARSGGSRGPEDDR